MAKAERGSRSLPPPVPGRTEILAIGSELLAGRIADSNSAFLAGRVTALGGQVTRLVALPDNPRTVVSGLRAAVRRRCHLILTTGGLGPTSDDRTVQALATWTRSKAAPVPAMLELYRMRRPDRVGGTASRPVFPPAWLKMASAPAGAEALINRDGWAPAIHLLAPAQPGCHVYTFPGPPGEMQPLFEEQVAPRLAALFPRKSLARRVEVNVHESDVAPLLDQLMATYPGSYLKAYVSLRTPEWLPVDVVVLDDDLDRASEQLNRLLGAFAGLMSGLGELRLEMSREAG